MLAIFAWPVPRRGDQDTVVVRCQATRDQVAGLEGLLPEPDILGLIGAARMINLDNADDQLDKMTSKQE
jgi:hypothetical protein